MTGETVAVRFRHLSKLRLVLAQGLLDLSAKHRRLCPVMLDELLAEGEDAYIIEF